MDEVSHVEIKAANKIAEVKKRVAVTKRETFRPDGTLASRTTKKVGDTTTKTSDTDVSEKTDKTYTFDRSIVQDYRRDWRVTALVGAQLRNPIVNGGNPFSPNLLIGVNAERRIIGPVWAGLFVAGTFPTVGLRDIRTQGALYGGLSLSVEF